MVNDLLVIGVPAKIRVLLIFLEFNLVGLFLSKYEATLQQCHSFN